MSPGQADRLLSELELAALGYLWRHGPCTAYRVRLGFQKSPSSHWSGSSGAIYPLLRRLERRGLVQSLSAATGSRPRKLLSVTAEGHEALRRWLGSGVDLSVASAVHDGLRTRMFFLDLLPAAARLGLVRSALRSCEEHRSAIERDIASLQSAGDRFGRLAARGAWYTARARLAWLREIETNLLSDED